MPTGFSWSQESVKPSGKSYDDAVQRIENEYKSAARQTRVKNCLSELRIKKLMIDGTDMTRALSNIYNRCLTMSCQVSESHRGDAHIVEFLRNAVFGHPWAHEALERIVTAGLSFQ